jgi:putative intracellular protease/amidase
MSRVLMVVSSRSKLGDTEQPTGAWLEELAAAYWVFVEAGHEVTLASPQGGTAPLDPLSLQDPWITADGKRFVSDSSATRSIAATRALADVNADEFDAIYLVGGVATAWDFPGNPELTAIVEALHRANRPVSGVCHGVLGLTDALRPDGAALVKGKKVTGVSNAEETLTGFDKIVPVFPENRMKERGAIYSCAAPLAAHVVADGKVLTGQNPASAGPLAREVLKYL